MGRQRSKERACYLAATRGMALFSRGHFVFAVTASGHVRILCGSRSPADVWVKAHQVLQDEEQVCMPAPRTYRVVTPRGVYEAPTWHRVLWYWLVGHLVMR